MGQGIVEANDMNQYTLASNFSPPGTVSKDDESDSDDDESSKPQLYDNSNQFSKAQTIDEDDEAEDVIAGKREVTEVKKEAKEGAYLLVDE